MGDSPFMPAPATNTNLRIGNATPRGGGAAIPERFDTYVMYRPRAADWAGDRVWVALGKVHWEWGLVGTNNGNGPWQSAPLAGVAAPTVTIPVGEPEWFPGWTDKATRVLGQMALPGFPGWSLMGGRR